jgi:hypothetical protein
MARRARITAAAIAATLILTAQTTIEDLPMSALTAGGPPAQVYIIQETAQDAGNDLTSVIAAATALLAAAGAVLSKMQKARQPER